jgi:glyoxylase-like metal-dependent hydrolase (beta-lactamase superfamily II)
MAGIVNDATLDSIVYAFEDLPPDGEAWEVADGIYWASLPVPFTGLRQVNVWLLRDGDGWTMIDSGHGDEATRDRLRAIWSRVLGGKPVTRLILTHFHPDHAGNCGIVSAFWGGLLPRMAQAEWFAANLAVRNAYTDHISDRSAFHEVNGLDPVLAERFGREVLLYSDGVQLSPSYRRLQPGDVVRIGEDDWVTLLGQGHSPEHLSLYCEKRRILIAGDQVLPGITTNVSVWPTEPEADPLALFLGTCKRFYELLAPETFVLPSHRRPFRNVRARLRDLDLHHAARLSVVLRAAGSPVTAGELLPVMFDRPLDGHQVGFAMGEALAHLNHLVERGLMRRLPIQNGERRFCRSPDAPDFVGPSFVKTN